MTTFSTEQEAFWAGEFGSAYVERNSDPIRIARRTAFFAKVLSRTHGVSSVLELGANIGLNLVAIRNLLPQSSLTGIEINATALARLSDIAGVRALHGSIFDFSPEVIGPHDLTFTSGVLIHINPDRLPDVYDRLYQCSRAYVLINEYYNPTPVEVSYRGHSGRLFKRDFAGEMLDRFPDLELVDYGFQYHRDPNFPADDATWMLLKKKA